MSNSHVPNIWEMIHTLTIPFPQWQYPLCFFSQFMRIKLLIWVLTDSICLLKISLTSCYNVTTWFANCPHRIKTFFDVLVNLEIEIHETHQDLQISILRWYGTPPCCDVFLIEINNNIKYNAVNIFPPNCYLRA